MILGTVVTLSSVVNTVGHRLSEQLGGQTFCSDKRSDQFLFEFHVSKFMFSFFKFGCTIFQINDVRRIIDALLYLVGTWLGRPKKEKDDRRFGARIYKRG